MCACVCVCVYVCVCMCTCVCNNYSSVFFFYLKYNNCTMLQECGYSGLGDLVKCPVERERWHSPSAAEVQ